ncbi:MAG: STAS/SEC14 domain-containing protein [Hyphomicrobium sp.]
MLEILKGYPDDVLAISAKGEVTADDYAKTLIPELNARIAKYDAVRMLYELGPEYTGFSAGAAWADMRTGISNWSKFERIAVVTDVGWIRDTMHLFVPFFHHAMRVFSNAELAEAHDWIISKAAAA